MMMLYRTEKGIIFAIPERKFCINLSVFILPMLGLLAFLYVYGLVGNEDFELLKGGLK